MHTETGTRLSKTQTQLLRRGLKWVLADKDMWALGRGPWPGPLAGALGWHVGRQEVLTDLSVCRQEVGKRSAVMELHTAPLGRWMCILNYALLRNRV